MKTIKKYIPTVIVLSLLIGGYTLAFVYSCLAVVLLTALLFVLVALIVTIGKNAQLKEINDKLINSLNTLNESMGKLLVHEQFVTSILEHMEGAKNDEPTNDEEDGMESHAENGEDTDGHSDMDKTEA